MSATLDADKFASYWGMNTPRIHIPGRTFPVTDFMLEDVLNITGYIPPKNKKKKGWHGNRHQSRKSTPWNDSERSDEENEEEVPAMQSNGSGDTAIRHSIPLEELLKRVDETDLDYDLLGRLVCHLVQSRGPEDDGSILVFLSGAAEISNAIEAVKRIGRNLPLLVLPLHGGLQPKDQRLVFQPPRNGLTKVIFSTSKCSP
jgi:HrpA-like RNA helicase